MAEKLTMLFVDDNPDFLASISVGLSEYFNIITAYNIPSAKKQALRKINAVLLDIRLDDSVKENRDGLELLSWFKDEFPQIPVVMISAVDEFDVAVEAMRLGASDYILKSPQLNPLELVKSINNAVEKAQLERKVHNLEQRLERLESCELIGESMSMLKIKLLIDSAAEDGKVDVLIRGETGTGKELVARAIHDRGTRKGGPFVPVSLSAFSREILSSELFGHEKGAFTDAKERRIGYIEKADGGILFLDEIGELTPDVQVMLLRVLETKEVTRLGGSTKPIPVDFQLVAATNLDLEQAVAEIKIRKDFYFRLKNFVIHIPPLAERGEDIPLLANHFLQRLNRQGRTTIQEISPEALKYLIAYDWPGNVRELEHCIESAILKAKIYKDDVILPCHLPDEVRERKKLFGDHQEKPTIDITDDGIDIDEKLARMELAYIEEALKKSNGKKTEAWKLLGYNDRYKMKRRIDSILTRYPELSEQFYLIRNKYS